MKILYLMPTPPLNGLGGSVQRTSLFIEGLMKIRNVEVHVVSYYTKGSSEKYERYVRRVNTLKYTAVRPSQSLSSLVWRAKLLAKFPFPFVRFFDIPLRNTILKLIEKEKIDVLLIATMQVGVNALLMQWPIPVITDFIDAKSMYWDRRYKLAHPILKLPLSLEIRRLSSLERELARVSTATLVISQVDRDYLSAKLGVSGIYAIRSPWRYTQTTGKQEHNEASKMPVPFFSGNFDYFPNRDGLAHLINDIIPIISNAGIELKVRLCGAGSLPSKLARSGCIEWLGRVQDLQQEMKQAHIFVSPIRVGSGIKNKILEAMWAGLPVVCYDVSNEGINARHGVDILIAKNATEFAELTVRLIEDFELRRRIAANGRRFVEDYLEHDTSIDLFNLLSQFRGK